MNKKIDRKAIILYSGGLDSTTLLLKFKEEYKEIYALTFNYGQRHQQELIYAKDNCISFKVKQFEVDIPYFKKFNSSLLGTSEVPKKEYDDESIASTNVPFRNGVFLAIAVSYAENYKLDDVIIGSHSGLKIHPDCSPDFNRYFNLATNKGTLNKINIRSPFENKTKTEVATLGLKLGIDFKKTWSCHENLEDQCGTCGSCLNRNEAINSAYRLFKKRR